MNAALPFADPADVGGVPPEVVLVAALRRSPDWIPRLSLVAVDDDGGVVGHVVCTRARVGAGHPVLALGPIGVRPDHQRVGTGSALVPAVLGAAEALDEALVGLLGDPAYCTRFGFRPAATVGIAPPDPSWGRYFQIRTLNPSDEPVAGRFRYPAPFDAL
ncbi:MAG: N-acetyltransferase [Actinobacteria bacterium]|nr:N-acetyltransferase [Actinomycetota bacterium]